MKKLRKISMLFLVLVMWVAAVFSVSAATQVKDGLDITVQTDKQKYETNEKITAWITVKNTNSFGVDNVSVECVIPAGYKAEGNASLTIPTLASWEQKTLAVILVPGAGSVPKTGDSSNVLLWSVLAILAVAALATVCLKLRKGHSSMLALLLCAAMVLASLPMGTLEVQAENTTESVTVAETVEVGSEKLTIEGKVTYNAFVIEEEADNSGSEPGGNEPGGDEPGGNEPGGNEPGGDEPGGDEPGGDEPGGDEPGGDEPGGNEPGGDEPGGNEPGGNEPGGDEPGGNEPGGDEPGGDEPGGDEPGGNEPGGNEPGGDEPGGDDVSGGDVSDGDVSDGDVSGGDGEDGDETNNDIEVFVSPDGDDTNPGTIEAPVKTLEGARDLVRQLKADRVEAGDSAEVPVTVYLRGGEYVLSRTFTLAAEDSGTEAAPVVYRAYQDEEVTVTGSHSYDFSKFTPVTGEMKDKLPESARDHVVVADAADLGLNPIEIGIKEGCHVDAPIMMLDEAPMLLTRYPNGINAEYWMKVRTDNPVMESAITTLNIDDELMWSWDYNTEDFIYSGYVAYAWHDDAFFGTQNREKKQVTSLTPTVYGSRSGAKPLRVFNAYQSIDEPGEWYYDTDTDKLYMYPHEGATAESRLYVTESNFDLIYIQGAAYISIEGMTITSSAQNGVMMDGAKNCVVNNCHLFGFEDRAFRMVGETSNSGIKNSDIAYTSSSIMGVGCGDFNTMTPGNNFASNNLIHDGQLYRQYAKAAIGFGGVGNKFDHNEVYNIPLLTISFVSLDGVMEYNTFHDCNINGQDMGVLYAYRNGACLGNVIQYNHFYDLGNGADYNNGDGGLAIYLDEGTSGTIVKNNIIGPGASAYQSLGHINRGHDNIYTNNLLIDTDRMMRVCKNVDTDKEFAEHMLETQDDMWDITNNQLYIDRWPWLAAIRDYKQGVTPIYTPNTVSNNVLIAINADLRTGSMFYNEPETVPVVGMDSNLYIAKDKYDGDNRNLFADYENGDYRLNEEVLALTDFENINQTGIGLQTFIYDDKELLPGGNKPVASGVSIVGTVESGKEIKAAYTFTDADEDAEGSTIVEFWISDSSDPFYLNWRKVSATSLINSYIVSEDCVGKWIRCKVVPVDEHRVQGEAVWSEPIYVELTEQVDTTELEQLLADAEEFMKGVTVGDDNGQWKQSQVDTFNAAIADAKAVLNQETLFPYQYKEALEAFEDAYALFKLSQNKTSGLEYVSVSTLLADTANWKTTNVTPVFANGTMTVTNNLEATESGNNWGPVGYAGEQFTNKLFRFSYQQTVEDGMMGGFFLDLDEPCGPELLWSGRKIAVVTAEDRVELQFYGGAQKHKKVTKTGEYFKDGQTYDIVFGMYDVSATAVRIVLMVDGEMLFDEEVEDTKFVSAKSYFCVSTSHGGCEVVIGESTGDAEIDTRNVSILPLIQDTANWKTLNIAPVFADGTMTVTNNLEATESGNNWGPVGYAGKKFTNKIFHFSYQQTVEKGMMGGFFLDLDEPCGPEMLWSGRKIAVVIKEDQVELQFKGGAEKHQMVVKKGEYFKNGETYDVAFGMYDISETSVRVVLEVDGEPLFDEEVVDANYVSAESYFCVSTSHGGCEVVIGESQGEQGDVVNRDVSVAPLLSETEKENWTITGKIDAVFENNTLSITGNDGIGNAIVAYGAKSYPDKIYRFKYQHTMPSKGNTAFYLDLDEPCTPEAYWSGKKIVALFSNTQVSLMIRGVSTGNKTLKSNFTYDPEKTYDVSFGFYDVSETAVRVVLTVDGVTLFDEEVVDESFVAAESYLCFTAGTNCTITVK